MKKCLHDQISVKVEAYIDDIIIKSRCGSSLLSDLEQTFTDLCRFSMKLNPEKCIFEVPAGKLLGFIASQGCTEANPEKIQTITNLKPPETIREVQKLAGCMAALSHFISQLGEKALPLYRLLRKNDKFYWSLEVKAAFADLKRLLQSNPLLASPAHSQNHYCYTSWQPLRWSVWTWRWKGRRPARHSGFST